MGFELFEVLKSHKAKPYLIGLISFGLAVFLIIFYWNPIFYKWPLAPLLVAVAVTAWQGNLRSWLMVYFGGLGLIYYLSRIHPELSFLDISMVFSLVSGMIGFGSESRRRLIFRLRNTLSHIHDGFFILDWNWRFSYVNDKALQIFNKHADEVYGKRIWEIFPELAEDAFFTILHKVKDEKETAYGERPLVFGTKKILADFQASSNKIGISVTLRDLTSARKAEETLLEIEDRFRIMADRAPVLIWMAGVDGEYTYFNKVWLDFTGRTMAQELGMGWTENLHSEDYQECIKKYREAFQAREGYVMDYRMRRADGTYRWITDYGTPRFLKNGEFAGYIGSGVDITERKVIEEERADLLAREKRARLKAEDLFEIAERASQLKDEFLVTLSHELRTPMNAILGWAEILKEDKLPEKERKTAIDVINRNAKTQTHLINDILDMSRIISGKIKIEAQTVEIMPVVKAAIATIMLSAQAKNIRVTMEFDPSTGPVSGDQERLQQVVWNLLSNAVKFTPRDGQIKVSVRRHNSRVEIIVVDSGEGIDPGFLPFVFDRFRQADGSMARRHGGLGLGLAIVRQIVELHGGYVLAQSEGKGKGAKFIVSLPIMAIRITPLERQDLTAGKNTEAHTKPIGRLVGLTVLAIDDHEDVLNLIQTVLKREGANVLMASSVKEALGLLSRGKPHVILSDIEMPHETGFDLIRKLRALSRDEGGETPAAALTAHAKTDDRQKVLDSGFQMHVAKPVEPKDLVNTVVTLSGCWR